MPKVSVIVPIYNTENYLERCLDSIINQTLKDIEIICVNDGSIDRSCEILDSYATKDTRIKVIHQPNAGHGAACNSGLEAATGDYVGIVESDDFVALEMYENLHKIITKNNCDIVKSDYFQYWKNSGKTVKCGMIQRYKAGRILNAHKDKRLINMPPSIWTSLYRRDFLDENGIRFLQTPGASYQDTSFAFKTMAAANRVILTDKAYVYYTQDNAASSVTNRGKIYCICEEYAEIERFLKANSPLDEYFMPSVFTHKYKKYLWNLGRIDKKFHLEFVKYFAGEFRNFYETGKLDKNFFKKHKRKDLLLLINEPEKFLTKFIAKEVKKKQRRKFISVHINSSRISIVVFDKQIVRIG